MKNPTSLQVLLNQSYETEKTLRHFSQVTSSELPTLLAFVLGELEGATENVSSIEAAKRAAERALFISKNLRYFAAPPNPINEPCDISQLILDTLSLVEKKFLKVQFNVSVEASVLVLLDAGAFEQALFNLIFFCASQIKEGGIVHLDLQILPRGIQLALSNESSQNSKNESTGFVPITAESFGIDSVAALGIQVARNIFELQSGKLHIFQSASEGTQFICELPLDSRLNKPHLYHEKRRFKRVLVHLEGELRGTGNLVLPCRFSILSMGGGFVALSQDWVGRFKVEDQISLKIFSDTQSQIEIPLARIANTHTQCDHSGLGIEFLELDSKAKNLLAALVKAHASYGV